MCFWKAIGALFLFHLSPPAFSMKAMGLWSTIFNDDLFGVYLLSVEPYQFHMPLQDSQCPIHNVFQQKLS